MQRELITDLLRDNAVRRGDQTALIVGNTAYSYQQLNAEANRFANGLLRRGIHKGDAVIVQLPRDERFLIAMFGILKTGAVYVPVGLDYPQRRVERIRESSKAVLIVRKQADSDAAAFQDILTCGSTQEPDTSGILPSDPCIIMYTSGSTGEPKGVMQRHEGLVKTGDVFPENYAPCALSEEGTIFLSITTQTFLLFYVELCDCLGAGCTILLANQEQSRSPMLMARMMEQYGVNAICGTPTRIQQYLNIPVYAQAARSLRVICVAGERIPTGLPELIHELAPQCQLFSLYGLTEAAISMSGRLTHADSPIYACHNYGFLVVNEANRETADGETGELLLSGPNLMVGYVNLPEEMAAKFVRINGTRYFRTGDLAKRAADGGLTIVGRKDHQIKLRGLRIEPGEIEIVMQSFPEAPVIKAVVRVSKIHGADHLTCWYTGPAPVEEKALKAHLALELPSYMIPDYFMYLKDFPLNPNGKIDYKALPAFELEDLENVAPQNDLEAGILTQCRRIVGYEDFGVTTPLDNVGFTSLKYIELAAMLLDEYRTECSLTSLMSREATVRSLAELVRGSNPASGETESASQAVQERYPLTPQLYSFTINNPTNDIYRRYNFSDRWKDAYAIRKAFVKAINAHPYLFTVLRREEGTWYQIPHRDSRLSEEEIPILTGEPSQKDVAAFCRAYQAETAQRLFDVTIYQGEQVSVLLHMHHLLLDRIFEEKLLKDIRRILSDPDYLPTEGSDYFAYTDEILSREPTQKEDASQPHSCGQTPLPTSAKDSIRTRLSLPGCAPILQQFHLQPADYLFGLFAQAWLIETGQEAFRFGYIFGGRNDARYFSTAGFFPIRMSMPVKRDPQFCETLRKDILSEISQLSPQEDIAYRILIGQDIPRPYVLFNCMELIAPNEDFETIALQGSNRVVDAEFERIAPDLDFVGILLSPEQAAVQLTFRTDVADRDTIQRVVDSIPNLHKTIIREMTKE